VRKKYRMLIEKVQKQKREQEENELKNMKRGIWRHINKKRGKIME